MEAYSSSRSVAALACTWQMMAVRRSQRSQERLQASSVAVIGSGCSASSPATRCVATSSTRSHQAPVTISSSNSGRASMEVRRVR
jgi:hypothetical protein